jgi:hypothetical protein
LKTAGRQGSIYLTLTHRFFPLKKKSITEHRYKPMLVGWVFSERTSDPRFDILKVVVGSLGVSLSLIFIKKIKLAISDLTIFEKFKSLWAQFKKKSLVHFYSNIPQG